jgi:AcrR family transcriptional regulator
VTSFILSTVEKRRARSDDDKARRAAEILDAARQSVDEHRFDTFTMDDVAARLGLAKGTLYRYHATREALLLAVLQDDLTAWFADVDTALAGGAAVVDAIVPSLLARPRVMRLLAVLPTVLEHNVPMETATSFKHFLLQHVAHTGSHIDRTADATAGSGARLLLQLNAAVVGLYHSAQPAPVVAEILARPEFAPLRVDLAHELTSVALALLAAVRPAHEGALT